MADPDAVRAAVAARHTAQLRAETHATQLELAIADQQRTVDRLYDKLDRALLTLRALEAQRKPEGKTNGKA